MDQPGECTSEPFEFRDGGTLDVEGRPSRVGAHGVVEFRLEGSEDKAYWAEVLSGSVSHDQRVELACRSGVAPWGRLRMRAIDGSVSVSVRVRKFRAGDETEPKPE